MKTPNLENTYFRGGAQQGQTHEERASFIYSQGDEKASCELREKGVRNESREPAGSQCSGQRWNNGSTISDFRIKGCTETGRGARESPVLAQAEERK